MEDFKNGHRSQFSEQWFIAIQDRNYKASTLCNYKNLCEQFKLLGLDKKEIADEAFYVQGSEEKTDEKLRHTINTLNDLRNPIVHEASIDILSLEAISLEEHEVIDLMENINKIVEAIIKVMERKIS
ncbi:HEPN domain-containing protein [Dubosiella newyorkensis]